MDYSSARSLVLDLLKKKGKARNSEMIRLIDGDESIFQEIREEFIFEDIAEDKKNVGLIYIGDVMPPEPVTPGETVALDKSSLTNFDYFISYSTEDKKIADQLVNFLEAHGIKCWIAPRDIQKEAGRDYAECLIEALYSAKGMILVFSNNANNSQFVKKEVDRIVARNIPIIAFRVEEHNPTGAMEFYLCTSQWLDGMPPPVEQHLDLFLKTAKIRLKKQEDTDKPEEDLQRIKKAFQKSESVNITYSAFWIGARIAPALDLFSQSRRLKEKGDFLRKTLFESFEEHEKNLGVTQTAKVAFNNICSAASQEQNDSIKRNYFTDLGSEINQLHGSEATQWLTLGVSLSSLWSQFKHGGKSVPKERAIQIAKSTFEGIYVIYNMSPFDTILYERIKSIEKRFNETPNDFGELLNIINDLSISMESFLITGECEISCEIVQPILEKNPSFAIHALKRFLELHPDNILAYQLCGKACAAEIYSGKLRIDPLFQTDNVETMAWSLEESLKREPDPDRKDQIRDILSSISKFRKPVGTPSPQKIKGSTGTPSSPPSQGKLIWKPDFNDTSLSGWSALSFQKVDWRVDNGICRGDGLGLLISETHSWGDIIFQCKSRIISHDLPQSGILLSVKHQTGVEFPPAYHITIQKDGVVSGERFEGKDKKSKVFFVIPFSVPLKTWIDLKLVVNQKCLSIFIDDKLISDIEDDKFSDGAIGIGVVKAKVEFKDMYIYQQMDGESPQSHKIPETKSIKEQSNSKKGFFRKFFNK